ncbi:outer membrane homotrimeric porin [Desulfomicrobium sp. ZS1]|uniref:outer membrane homotrimeric porin n=1 Tax=Desulfomicrobium sp. ZS1 TaxID=2952228 RepID=UPI0020B1BFED|nr:outer membrane homotrimeric porin [Desulfomicrobium sp. ZS1]UTF49162.1 outer membrane homotrimeric porin [Desulfomicrobium sp. ZS1]
MRFSVGCQMFLKTQRLKEEVVKTRFILHCAASIVLCAVLAASASATELKVRGNLDVYGMWSTNLKDHNSEVSDADNYMTTQRMRTYFDYVANENLKAVLGLEIDNVWGDNLDNVGGDWGTDGKGNIEVKHAYMDFTLPESQVNIKAGLQYVALPSVFGNPVFENDAAALVVSAPLTDMLGLAVGYSRGVDGSYNTASAESNSPLYGENKDDVDMAFLLAPIKLDGFAVSPYVAYAWLGQNTLHADLDGDGVFDVMATDDATALVFGANAELTMFDPLTFAADFIYGQSNWQYEDSDIDSDGWYAALAASYKFDVLTATLFTTYATGFSDVSDDDIGVLPTLAEGWGLSPYIGGVRAFSTTYDSFATDTLGVGSDGTGLWTMGLVLDNISFVDKLSHTLVLAYAQGTSDEDSIALFTEEDSGVEAYLVNKYMIYENLAAINELGYFSGSSEDLEDLDYDLDASYFATLGFSYKF